DDILERHDPCCMSRFPIRVTLSLGPATYKGPRPFLRRLAAKDLERLFAFLPTFEHQKGIRLFDDLAKDPANAAPILQELLLVVSNHDDPQLHTPHGLLTLEAGRDLLRLTRPPGGLGLLRFLVLYNFSLQKRALTTALVEAEARAIPAAPPESLMSSCWAVSSRTGSSIASRRSSGRSHLKDKPTQRIVRSSSPRALNPGSWDTR